MLHSLIPRLLGMKLRAPVVQLGRASDGHLEHPGLNPGWISMPFTSTCACNSVNKASFLTPLTHWHTEWLCLRYNLTHSLGNF